MTLEELQRFSDVISEDVFEVLGSEGSANSRNTPGGTAIGQVKKALEEAESELGIH